MLGVSALEDVPVIVPIVVALLLFFSSLNFALDRVSKANNQIDLTLKALELADVFTQGTIITQNGFNASCEVAKTSFPGFGFVVAIMDIDASIRARDPQQMYSSLKSKSPRCFTEPAPGKKQTVIVKAVPVVSQEIEGGIPVNKLKKMVVMIWKA